MINILSICLCVITVFSKTVKAELSADFQKWIAETYGEDVRATLTRKDLGDTGSFGGKASRSEVVRNQPIVFVHGVSDKAGDKALDAAKYFKKNGYEWSELYGTTYANGNEGDPLKWAHYTMQCSYVKQVRALIVAVRLYTGRAVDVISYSLGVPVTRKAILGGQCVDTGEDLGGPLTKFVDTFIGVAGPNHGIALQFGGISVPACALALLPICNPQIGLYSGICPIESQFLQNINAYGTYEGQNVYSIYSKADQLVGHMVCNKVTTQVPGQKGEKVYADKNHDNTWYHSYEVMKQMALNHVVA